MFYPLLNFVAYVFMIVMNGLAFLPIGGLTTKEISDKYATLFTPAGFTFSIWSVIYALLLVFVIAGVVNALRGKTQYNKLADRYIGPYFALSCLWNGLWILAWQYQYLGLSVVIILALFFTVATLHVRIHRQNAGMTWVDRYITHPAVSIYFGWISVAVLANISAWLVSVGIIPSVTLTIVMVVIAALMAVAMFVRCRDYLFVIVILWAMYGIMKKGETLSSLTFVPITATLHICMGFLVGLMTCRLFLKK